MKGKEIPFVSIYEATFAITGFVLGRWTPVPWYGPMGVVVVFLVVGSYLRHLRSKCPVCKEPS